ncbi:MAG TPA: PHP domain-containing protein, partial [Solirubrobacterales bacterium]|nr:PHP domain-containing protein [Solirubrobacterales bacterium]
MSPYVELHCHSAHSFLDGASSPAELAETAAALGYPALALTDHDGIWGSMEFAQACKGAGVRPITGAELSLEPAPGEIRHLTLLVADRSGYANLCRLLTAAHAHTRDGPNRAAAAPHTSLERLAEHAEGLICLSGCARDGLLAGCWPRGETKRAEPLGRRLLEIFGRDRLRVELQRPYWRHDRARNRWLSGLAERLGVPTVATGNVHSHDRARARLQDALVAVRRGSSLEASESWRRGNSSSVLARPAAMAERFVEHPEAVAETVRLAERLEFDLTAGSGYRYPGARGQAAERELARICRERLHERYGAGGGAGGQALGEAAARLDQELAVIGELGLAGFFLLHHDLLELAREVAAEVRGPGSARAPLPPGRGRGSSVSSLVCYLTGLSHIDPIHAGLRPGRFLNPEVSEPPDIDLDFPRDIRERLIPRVHERYGADNSALIAAFPTHRSRGAIRDFGKALGLPPAEIERAARTVHFHGDAEEVRRGVEAAIGAGRARTPRWRHLVALCRQAYGLPRHASQHSGGMVISTRPLTEMCPVVPAAMAGRQIVQWDKDSCADAGFLKIDLLGLGMLSAVERCVEEIERVRGERIDLSRIPLDDTATFDSIRRADTTGTFQIESRAQMQMLIRTQPRSIEDLTV